MVRFSRRGYSDWAQQVLGMRPRSVYGRRGMREDNRAEEKITPVLWHVKPFTHKSHPASNIIFYYHFYHTFIFVTADFLIFPLNVLCFHDSMLFACLEILTVTQLAIAYAFLKTQLKDQLCTFSCSFFHTPPPNMYTHTHMQTHTHTYPLWSFLQLICK